MDAAVSKEAGVDDEDDERHDTERDHKILQRFELEGFGTVTARRRWGDAGGLRQVRLSWHEPDGESTQEVYMLIPTDVWNAITTARCP